jgi:hypothetical protein
LWPTPTILPGRCRELDARRVDRFLRGLRAVRRRQRPLKRGAARVEREDPGQVEVVDLFGEDVRGETGKHDDGQQSAVWQHHRNSVAGGIGSLPGLRPDGYESHRVLLDPSPSSAGGPAPHDRGSARTLFHVCPLQLPRDTAVRLRRGERSFD